MNLMYVSMCVCVCVYIYVCACLSVSAKVKRMNRPSIKGLGVGRDRHEEI